MTDETEAAHHPNGPSWMNAGASCIWYRSGPSGPAAERGTRIHEAIAKVLRDGSAWITAGDAEDNEAIEFALATAKEYLRHVDGIERRLELREGHRTLTFGTIDAYGRSHTGDLTILDWKTGARRDHRPQAAAYALLAMDECGENEAEVVFVYLDEKVPVVHHFTRGQAEGIVLRILDRVRDGKDLPTINQWCGFCADRHKCPAWKVPGATALAVVDEDLAELFAGGLQKIAADPEAAGKWWSRWKMVERLVDDADFPGAIRKHLESGERVPGFKLQNRKGRSTIDSGAWLERIAPVAGAEAAAMITVSVPAVSKWWTKASQGKPMPVAVIEAPATTSVVAANGGD
jgi:hypothetical protein